MHGPAEHDDMGIRGLEQSLAVFNDAVDWLGSHGR